MNKILVINAGSTSLKFKIFEKEKAITADRWEISNKKEAVKRLLRQIGDLSELSAVGHRVVHGGNDFSAPTLITDEVLNKLTKLNDLAPLHNPHNLAFIQLLKEYVPHLPQVAVFDTAFFNELPLEARFYALPRKLAQELGIRRYGFHGISHQFVAEEAARQLGKPLSRLNLITCHLGGGWSAAAIRRGKPIDVSMGFTPLEGLVMMTRCGDIDAGAVFYLIKHLSVELGCQEAVKKVYELLNFQSGIKGLSEGTDSYLDLVREVSLGNEEAQSALALAFYRLSKYIAGYWLALGGRVDAIVLTGAIGAGDPFSRQELARRLRPLGKIKILRVKTQEELMIARQTRQILRLV